MEEDKDSPVVQSVREARRQIAEECGNDIDKFFRFIKDQEKKDRGLFRSMRRTPLKRTRRAAGRAS